MKLTAKQERFARELAKGKTQYESFCIAYPLQAKNSKRETLDVHASTLSKKDKIMTRVNELQENALKHVKYGIEEHFNELEEMKELALPKTKDGKINKKLADIKMAIKAVELKGKVKGHYVIKTENTNKNTDLTEAEIERKLKEYAEKEGLSWEEFKKKEGF